MTPRPPTRERDRGNGWQRQRDAAVRRMSPFLPQSPQLALGLQQDEAPAPPLGDDGLVSLPEGEA